MKGQKALRLRATATGLCLPQGLETEDRRGPMASRKNKGTFPQRGADTRALPPWRLRSKRVCIISPESGQD